LSLVAVALPVAIGAAQEPEKRVSWSDASQRFGWIVVESGPPAFAGDPERDPSCRGARAGAWMYVCSTEDGGRTWHSVFQAGNGLMYVLGYTRTSRNAGVVSIGREDMPRTLRNGVFWTVDNGRHWFETTRIGRSFEGRDARLFWNDRSGRRLYQVHPWPPTRSPRCRGFFAWHPQDQRRRKDGSVCVGARENAGMRSKLVATIPGDEEFVRFWTWRATPRGVVALIGPVLPLRILTREGDENRIHSLARPPVPAGTALSEARLEGEWPRFNLLGSLNREWFVWRTTDGGNTWSAPERR
jgi:hypothetical protein